MAQSGIRPVNRPFMEGSKSGSYLLVVFAPRCLAFRPALRSLLSVRRLALTLAPLALALALAVGGPGAAGARDDRDDDAARARAGVRAGRYVPLASILDWLEARYHGEAIEVELEEDDGERATYEVEWLTPQGRVIEFEFDARTGELLEREGRGLEEAAR